MLGPESYRRDGLVARFGADIALPDLLLASAPHRHKLSQKAQANKEQPEAGHDLVPAL